MPRISIRDDMPTVCVKDRNAWAHDTGEIGKLIGELSEEAVERAYEGAREQFWEDAKIIAVAHGYKRENVYQGGRSGGWLCIAETSFLDTVELDADVPEDLGRQIIDLEACDTDDDPLEGDEFERLEDLRALAELAHFKRFAEAITDQQKRAGDDFLERLREEKAELDERREAAIVLGYN